MFKDIEPKMKSDYDLFKSDYSRNNQADYYLMRNDFADYLVTDLNDKTNKRIYIAPNNVSINFPTHYPYRHVNKFSKYGETLAGWKSVDRRERSKKQISKRLGTAYSVSMNDKEVVATTDIIEFLNVDIKRTGAGNSSDILEEDNTVNIKDRVILGSDKDIFDYVDEAQKDISFNSSLPLIINGFAGTGKTVVLQQLALREIKSHDDSVLIISSSKNVVDDAKNFSEKNKVQRNLDAYSFEEIQENIAKISALGKTGDLKFSSDEVVLEGLNNIFGLTPNVEDNIEEVFNIETSPLYESYGSEKKLSLDNYRFVGIDEAPLLMNYSFHDRMKKNRNFCLAYDLLQHSEENIEMIESIFPTINRSTINIVHRTTKEIFEFAASFIGIDTSGTEFAYSDPGSVKWTQESYYIGPGRTFKISEIDTFIEEIVGNEYDVINVDVDVLPKCDPHKLYILLTRAKVQLNIFGDYAKELKNV